MERDRTSVLLRGNRCNSELRYKWPFVTLNQRALGCQGFHINREAQWISSPFRNSRWGFEPVSMPRFLSQPLANRDSALAPTLICLRISRPKE